MDSLELDTSRTLLCQQRLKSLLESMLSRFLAVSIIQLRLLIREKSIVGEKMMKVNVELAICMENIRKNRLKKNIKP